MAETQKGNKFVKVHAYSYRRTDGVRIQVRAHDRSTPSTSRGKQY